MMRFNGMEVVVDRPKVVRRDWWERLFARPWRPWQATKTVGPMLASPTDVIVLGGKVVMGEEAFAEMSKITGEPSLTGRRRAGDRPAILPADQRPPWPWPRPR